MVPQGPVSTKVTAMYVPKRELVRDPDERLGRWIRWRREVAVAAASGCGTDKARAAKRNEQPVRPQPQIKKRSKRRRQESSRPHRGSGETRRQDSSGMSCRKFVRKRLRRRQLRGPKCLAMIPEVPPTGFRDGRRR